MSLFKRKKEKFPKPSAPRTKAELSQEYTNLCARIGEMQFKVYALKLDIETINARILAVNNEGRERDELDKQTAAVEAQTKPETAPQEAANGQA